MATGSDHNTEVECHRPRLERLAARILGDRVEAADVVQEAMLAWLRRAGTVVAPFPWLLRTVANGARDRLRARRTVHDAAALESVASEWPGPPALARRRDERRRIAAALDELPDRQREAVTRRLVDGATFREIALSMGISEGAAKTHFGRGITNTRNRLGAGP